MTLSSITSGGSRISPRRGRQLPRGGCQHTNFPKFPKNCMKLKEFGTRGRTSLAPPSLDPPLITSNSVSYIRELHSPTYGTGVNQLLPLFIPTFVHFSGQLVIKDTWMQGMPEVKSVPFHHICTKVQCAFVEKISWFKTSGTPDLILNKLCLCLSLHLGIIGRLIIPLFRFSLIWQMVIIQIRKIQQITILQIRKIGQTRMHSRGVLVSVKFGCFSPSRFSHFHCNAMRKAIKAHKNLHTK